MKRALAIGFALVLAAGLGFAAMRVAERGRFASPYSTLGGGPDGTLALLRLAGELGHEARPLLRELSHMRGPGTLVALGNCQSSLNRELSRPEREALLRWVERGGLLIVAGIDDYVPIEAGLGSGRRATCENDAEQTFLERMFPDTSGVAGDGRVPFEVEAEPNGPPLSHMLPFLVTRASTVIQSMQDVEATTLLDSDEGPLGMTTALGRGRVVFLGTPDIFTNENIALTGGVVFARLLDAFAPKGPVWFDEYHLGVGERRSLFRYLRDLGYGPLLLQAALVILAALWAGATRLGEPRDEPPAKPRTTRSYLSALGALYARTRDKSGALDVLGQRALSRIARHYRTGSVPLPELERALAARGLAAVATYVGRIRDHAARPLGSGESLETRARLIDHDTAAVLVLGDAP
jgi:hypothetical protein